MPVDPPPLPTGAERAVRLYDLVGNQLREYRSSTRRKVETADGKDAWDETSKTTRVLDLTPLLLLLLLPPPGRRLVEEVLEIHRAMGAGKLEARLPDWVMEREREDPSWLARELFRLGVVGVPDPDAPEGETSTPD